MKFLLFMMKQKDIFSLHPSLVSVPLRSITEAAGRGGGAGGGAGGGGR